ncbi:MAG: HIT family protein [Patescibacteria group bacterium]
MDVPQLVVPGITNPSALASIARSRTYKQYCLMVDNALRGKCPFCEIDPKMNKVIAENEYWLAWPSPAPEKNTKHHFLIVSKRHITDTEELQPAEQMSLFRIMRELRQEHGYQSRGILIRDGDARLSAGTIEHLHIHVMVPDGTGRVESPFYKGVGEEELGVTRAIVFEKIRRGRSPEDLREAEYELIKGRL